MIMKPTQCPPVRFRMIWHCFRPRVITRGTTEWFMILIVKSTTALHPPLILLPSSPANDTPGHVVVDPKGHQIVELLFKTGTATNCNALLAWL